MRKTNPDIVLKWKKYVSVVSHFLLHPTSFPLQHLWSILLKLGFRCRRPKLGPRLVDPDRQAIHQYIGKRIAEAPPETVVLVEDETDLSLVPLLRRMWMKLCKQIILPAPITNQCRTIFGAINIHTGEIFYRYFARKRTIEMIAFLEDMMIHYKGC